MKKFKQKKKTLVIITGITGAIGSALLDVFTDNPNAVVYGISRKALPHKDLLVNKTKKLPCNTLIASVENTDFKSYQEFVDAIEFSCFEKVIYIHGLGHYPFEVNKWGAHIVEDDYDKDGINDVTLKLGYEVFTSLYGLLKEKSNLPTHAVFFQSLADEHKPTAHSSWWKVAEKTESYMKENASKDNTMLAPIISSVMCCHEILTRPYVFSSTDATQEHWLSPYQLARAVVNKFKEVENEGGYHSWEEFRPRPQFDKESYYNDREFSRRKTLELYGNY